MFTQPNSFVFCYLFIIHSVSSQLLSTYSYLTVLSIKNRKMTVSIIHHKNISWSIYLILTQISSYVSALQKSTLNTMAKLPLSWSLALISSSPLSLNPQTTLGLFYIIYTIFTSITIIFILILTFLLDPNLLGSENPVLPTFVFLMPYFLTEQLAY